jgi:hypothetical protein
MVAELIFRWERLTHECSRMKGARSRVKPNDIERDVGRGRGGRDNDRRHDRRGRGGHGTVHFDTKDKGTRICRAIVVVLILTVRIINVWYPYACLSLSSQR